jgi:hypothetical protein
VIVGRGWTFSSVAAGCGILLFGCSAILGIGDITAAPDAGDHGDVGTPASNERDATESDVPVAETGAEEEGVSSDDATSWLDATSLVDVASVNDVGLSNDSGKPADSSIVESGGETGSDTGVPSDAATTSEAGSEAEAAASCPTQTSQTIATKITFTVGWPSTTMANTGSGTVNIAVLTTVSGTNSLTGSSQFCGETLPDLILNSTGVLAAGGGSKVLIQVSNATWNVINRTFATTGTETGFNIGDSFDLTPSVFLLGLTNASGYGSDTKAWPPQCTTSCIPAGSFAMADIQDDDFDSNPGITAVPSSTNGYTLPPTASVLAAVASEVYMVFRTEVALTGMHAIDCAQATGTASITLFDNHVVGCKTICPSGGGGPGCTTGTTPQACTSSQAAFLDETRTIYGYDQSAGDVPSSSHPIVGSFRSIRLPAGAICADARAAFSPTFN